MSSVFWIVLYCLQATGPCYVSKDLPDATHKYESAEMCRTALHDGREPHKGSNCHAVTAVKCLNGGSRCEFTLATLRPPSYRTRTYQLQETPQ